MTTYFFADMFSYPLFVENETSAERFAPQTESRLAVLGPNGAGGTEPRGRIGSVEQGLETGASKVEDDAPKRLEVSLSNPI